MKFANCSAAQYNCLADSVSEIEIKIRIANAMRMVVDCNGIPEGRKSDGTFLREIPGASKYGKVGKCAEGIFDNGGC